MGKVVQLRHTYEPDVHYIEVVTIQHMRQEVCWAWIQSGLLGSALTAFVIGIFTS